MPQRGICAQQASLRLACKPKHYPGKAAACWAGTRLHDCSLDRSCFVELDQGTMSLVH